MDRLASGNALAPTRNELVPNLRGLGLCSRAEPRLTKALADRAFVVVNGLMLVKAFGDLVGLALKEISLPGGKTESGAWYEIEYNRYGSVGPDNSDWWKKDAIQSTFLKGGSQLDIPGVTGWLKLRDVRFGEVGLSEGLFQTIQSTASNLHDNIPMPDNLSRAEYFRQGMFYPDPVP